MDGNLLKLRIAKSEGLAHHSYYLWDEGEAIVIDPRRDCEVYKEFAMRDRSIEQGWLQVC